jgi:cation transport ATPase
MDLEQFKSQWQSVNIKVDRLSEANRELTQKLASQHAVSLKQKLAKKYNRIAIVGLCLPLLSFVLYYELNMPVWLCIVYAIFGLVAAYMNYNLAKFILHTDYISMPIAEAIKHAVKIRRRQRKTMMFLLFLALLVLWALFAQVYTIAPELMIACYIGLGIGVIIDIILSTKSFRLSKKILSELEDANSDE